MMGSSAANWTRAPAASPASPSSTRCRCGRSECPGARGPGPARGWAAARRTGRGPQPHRLRARSSERGYRGCPGCSGARGQDLLHDGQQRGELVRRLRHVRLPGPAGEVGAGGPGCPGARGPDPLADGQQRGELVPGPGRIPRLPGPAGEFGGRSGSPGARGPGPAPARAAARRAGRGPRPRPPPPRSRTGDCAGGAQSVRVLGTVGFTVLPGARGRLAGTVSRAARVAAAMAEGSVRSATCRRWSAQGEPGACGSSAAATGHVAGRLGWAGTAASAKVAAACRHWLTMSGRISARRVTAWTRRCTSTRPSSELA